MRESLLLFLIAFWAGSAAAAPAVRVVPGLYFIDAHSQMDQNVDEERVISLMDHGGVYRTILSTHMRRPWSDIADFAAARPQRIIAAVQIKGRGYHKGRARHFYSRLSGQLDSGRFGAMAEVLLWHDSSGGRFQEIRVDFDDALVRAAFDGARRKGWPFIIHIEFAALTADGRRSYMANLEAFLRKNPDHPFVMIHMGQLQAEPVARLLEAHPNLHFMTSHASPFYQRGGKPFITMFEGKNFKPQWRQLLIAYPERFVFALDNVFSKFWMADLYLAKMDLWWRAVAALPDPVAHALAHGNAERLWKLKPKPAGPQLQPPWITRTTMGPVTGYSAGRMKR